ncbi:hypothetical protein SARC_08120 [Sphaeroforma arctica JP610]|uniref:Insulin-induced gene 1 protein n=1 Tax=Sphaeroforma arctica JP610 TaxID=667725 RepID=A0A0L0FRN6_9EUKA|nr:hypothetical protein SARC_08120 [Sphaeroforma arctica JP610]KNC79487.1 hypothetical protein SARC_08120 [Sphaeroforma arctica JP610]|eukprot:XP_014153389.1 hypothetical protein SARC_08120 [Sphaeroforma arctica JP610]
MQARYQYGDIYSTQTQVFTDVSYAQYNSTIIPTVTQVQYQPQGYVGTRSHEYRIYASSKLPTRMMYTSIFTRVAILYTFGVGLCLAFSLLMHQHRVYTYYDVSASLFLVGCCGFAAVLVGLGYPYVDNQLGLPHKLNREWSSVVRCAGLLVGISYACAKLPNVTTTQLSVVVAFLALALWWLFDRSRHGLLLGVFFAFAGTVSGQLLAYSGLLWYTKPDFILVRSWFPSVLFSSAISFGSMGRQLAVTDDTQDTYETRDSFNTAPHTRRTMAKLKTT